jgi:hypothetical protein
MPAWMDRLICIAAPCGAFLATGHIVARGLRQRVGDAGVFVTSVVSSPGSAETAFLALQRKSFYDVEASEAGRRSHHA